MLTFDADPRRGEYVNYSTSELGDSPWTKYTKYCCQVTSLCDDYMASTGLGWRDGYYAVELHFMLAIYRNTKQWHWQPGKSPFLINASDSGNNPNLPPAESTALPTPSPSSSVREAKFTKIDSTIASQMNFSELPGDTYYKLPGDTYYELSGDTYYKLPSDTHPRLLGHTPYELPDYELLGDTPDELLEDTYELLGDIPCELLGEHPGDNYHKLSNLTHDMLFGHTNSALIDHSDYELATTASPTQPKSDVEPLSCDICGEEICSKPRDQRTNLKRHKDTVCKRNNRFICPEPECEERFPRADYLKNHKQSHQPHNGKQTRRRKPEAGVKP